MRPSIHELDGPDHVPSARELAGMGAFSLLLRVVVIVVAVNWFQVGIDQYSNKGDGASYKAFARAMGGDRHALDEPYDRRVFPGFPALIAIVHILGIPLSAAPLVVTVLSAALAAPAAAILFADRRIGWAMTALVPHYLINSSLAMSEAPLLALSLGGLVLVLRCRGAGMIVMGGILLGAAGLVRPMACFAVVGAMVVLVQQRRVPAALAAGAISAVVVAAGALALYMWMGSALEGARVYASHPGAHSGRMISFPFDALVRHTLHPDQTWTKVVHIWIYVAITLDGCVLMIWRWRKPTPRAATEAPRQKTPTLPSPGVPGEGERGIGEVAGRDLDTLALVWLVGNTLFVLCVGSSWGFHHFHRFIIPAQPALFWALRWRLPRNRACWVLIGCGLAVPAIAGVLASP